VTWRLSYQSLLAKYAGDVLSIPQRFIRPRMPYCGQLKPLRASWPRECSKVPLRGPVGEPANYGLCLCLYTDILHNQASYGHEEQMAPDPKLQQSQRRQPWRHEHITSGVLEVAVACAGDRVHVDSPGGSRDTSS
jgi:hypothetical protein